MKNVVKWTSAALAVILAFSVFSSVALADRKGTGQRQQTHAFVDADGDGVCDNFVDANGDGVCDTCVKHHHAANMVDENGDGVCDNFVDANGDGVCDGCANHQHAANFVDENGDGVCDNLVDADGDGVCDNEGSGAGKTQTPPATNRGSKGGGRGR